MSIFKMYFIWQGDLNIVASFDRRGKHIYTGNAKGKILVLDVETFEVVASFRIIVGTSSATAVKSIEFARRGEYVQHEMLYDYLVANLTWNSFAAPSS